VIASGGLSDIAELRAAAVRAHANVEGVISGRALYDGRIDAAQAIGVLKDAASAAGGTA